MKRIVLYSLTIFFLIYLSQSTLLSEDRLSMLESKMSTLLSQQKSLEDRGKELKDELDQLSSEIEVLKLQSRSGLGIIGRYKLSRSLKKAQSLSEELQEIEKQRSSLGMEINNIRDILVKEYQDRINSITKKIESTTDPKEREKLLQQAISLNEAKDKTLRHPGHLMQKIEIPQIELSEYDSPNEVREKADLLNDVANKLKERIKLLDTKITELKNEFRIRRKLNQFADELLLFDDRVSREQVVTNIKVKKEVEKPPVTEKPEITTLTDNIRSFTEAKPEVEKQEEIKSSTKDIIKGNRTSISLYEAPIDDIEEVIALLEKQKEILKSELSTVSEKELVFRKKANELEKGSRTKSVDDQKPRSGRSTETQTKGPKTNNTK